MKATRIGGTRAIRLWLDDWTDHQPFISALSGYDTRLSYQLAAVFGPTMKTICTVLSLAAALTLTAPAVAQPQGDYRHPGGFGGGYGLQLEGERVDSAKAQLSSAGYRAARNIRVDGRQYDLWSNMRNRNACVGFTSYKGTVTDVRSFPDADCGVLSDGGWRHGIDARDLNGMRVDDAKRNLRDHGYDNVRNVRIDGKQWDLWLSNRGRDCIGFTSYKGTITSAQSFRGFECDGNGIPGTGGVWLETRDLQGLRVDDAKRRLADAGFRSARNIRIGGQRWDLWYDANGRENRCVGFTSYNGRVTEADHFNARDCN